MRVPHPGRVLGDRVGILISGGHPPPSPRGLLESSRLQEIPRKIRPIKHLGIKICETKELARACWRRITVPHCLRFHDRGLGLWMARLDVTRVSAQAGSRSLGLVPNGVPFLVRGEN